MGCTNEKTSFKTKETLSIKDNSKTEQNQLEAKIIFLGDAGVGKSSICQRYIKNKVNETYEVTIGGAYFQKNVNLKNGSTICLHLWDTGGQERFKAMAPYYYRDANAAILVYDVSNLQTFKNLEDWVRELDSKVKQESMTLIVVSNKIDIDDDQKRVSPDMAKRFCENNNILFFEVSALKGIGITHMINTLADVLWKKITRAKTLK